MKSRNKTGLILLFATTLWMLFIFYLSSQTAQISDNLSKKITILLINIIKQIKDIDIISINHVGKLNNIIREYAHGFVYIVLSIFAVNALRGIKINVSMSCLLAFLISVAFACTDEIHQMFVPGRAAQLQDLMIDCAGALLGLVIFNIVAFFFRKTKLLTTQTTLSDSEEQR